MSELEDIQQEYLDQFIARASLAVFEDGTGALKNGPWHLVQHKRYSKELATTCDLIKENGKRCGREIQDVYYIKNASGKILKIGGTCMEKVVTVSHLTKIEKQGAVLRDTLVRVNQNYSQCPRTSLSKEEKEIIIEKLKGYNRLSDDIRMLYEAGAPLTEALYNGLKSELHSHEQHVRQMQEDEKRKREEWEIYQAECRRRKEEDKIRRERKASSVQSVERAHPQSLSFHTYDEKLKEAFIAAGFTEKIQTLRQARQICEIAIPIHVQHANIGRRLTYAYTDVVRDVGAYFQDRARYCRETIKAAIQCMQRNGYKIISSTEKEIKFQVL